MTEKVTGFVTSQGQFFRLEEEAVFHEALQQLQSALMTYKVRNVEAIINLVVECADSIMPFIEASIALAAAQPVAGTPSAAPLKDQSNDYEVDTASFDGDDEDDAAGQDDDNLGEADLSITEGETEAVLTLPPGVRKPMPNVGRYIKPAKVRHEGQVNGPRGRGGDAPGLRKR